jgi:hypothetical protein
VIHGDARLFLREKDAKIYAEQSPSPSIVRVRTLPSHLLDHLTKILQGWAKRPKPADVNKMVWTSSDIDFYEGEPLQSID